MRLWLITRTDETDWDETNAILVRAEDEAAARAFAFARNDYFSFDTPMHPGLREDNLVITEVKPDGEPGLIIRDFLRG